MNFYTIQSLHRDFLESARRGHRGGKERFIPPCPLYAPFMPSSNPLYAKNRFRLNSGHLLL